MATMEGGQALIGDDLVIQGEVRNGGEVEVRGVVLGRLAATRVVVHPGGRVIGKLDAEYAEVHGLLDGIIRVRNLISIGAAGTGAGDVRYGALALEPGGSLEAQVRNVPPHLTGDFEVVVRRGRSVRLTTADVDAHDPDNKPEELVYTVSNVANGHVALADEPARSVDTFTDRDMEDGNVTFVHDGNTAGTAGFDVVVSDSHGATSGAPRRVSVIVTEA